MNWMIDGAHGDLYRSAWQEPDPIQHAEWSIEMNKKPSTATEAKTTATGKTFKRTRLGSAVQKILISLHLRERFVS